MVSASVAVQPLCDSRGALKHLSKSERKDTRVQSGERSFYNNPFYWLARCPSKGSCGAEEPCGIVAAAVLHQVPGRFANFAG